ncbi:extracellular solute-binding protein [Stieleria marina]|uniref:extracellular solute-binding protein n=1 Tax=Stieleria marina TaxID=1930275 RepID=UPI003AF3AF2C
MQFHSCAQFNLIGAILLSTCGLGVSGCVTRSESDVVVYSALDRDFAAPILAAFQRAGQEQPTEQSKPGADRDPTTTGGTKVIAKYDIESTKTVGLVNRIIAERENPTCDLFWNNEILHTVRLQKMGLLEKRDWNVDGAWPKGMISSDGTWCGFAARARVLMVNTKLIANEEDYPQSVDDLADPKWSGKCAIARPLFGTTATHFAVLRAKNGEAATLKQLQAIKDNAVVLSGNKQVALAVSAGTVAWGLTDTDDAVIEKDLGRDVAIVFPDQASGQPGTLQIPNTVAVLKNAPHPIAANKLADFLVRPETEDRLAMGNSSQLPLSRQSKFPPRVLPESPVRWMRVDFEKAAEDWEPWAKQLDEMFQ